MPHDPIAIQVLSLQTATERRQRITAALDALGLKFRFFDAASPQELTVAEQDTFHPVRSLLGCGYVLNPGERACAASHLRLIAAAAQADLTLILEDDAQPQPELPAFLQALAASRWRDFDLIRLVPHRGGRPVGPAIGACRLLRPDRRVMNMHGYIVHGPRARQIARALGQRTVRSIDAELSRLWAHRLTILMADPPLVVPDPSQGSQIGARGWQQPANRIRLAGILRFLWRIHRIIEGLRRRMDNLHAR